MISLLTPEEAAAMLRVPTRWIYTHKTEVGAKKIGGYLRIPVESLNAYINREPESRGFVDVRLPINKKALVQRSMAEARESFRERRSR